MKKLALLCKTKPIGLLYAEELASVFGDQLQITVIHDDYNTCAPAGQLAAGEYDIILVTNVYSLNKSRGLIKNDPALVYLEFAFRREPIQQLSQYPVGTETLICFNFPSSSHQAASALYDIGIRNLNLYVNYPKNRNLEGKKFDLALISGPPSYEITGIPHIFDVGPRKIALSTMLEVAVKAELLTEETERKLYEYRNTIAVPDDYLDYSFNHSLVHQYQFQDIANCLEYPLLILDQHGVIKNCNKAFLAIASQQKVLGQPLREINLSRAIKQQLLQQESMDNYYIETEDHARGFLVSKEKLNKQDSHNSSYIVTIKDVSHIRNLEEKLRHQTRKKGYVTRYDFSDIKGHSKILTDAVAAARRIAAIDKPTLILGESGTGKELFAQSIHANSSRRDFPFIGINCAALPDTLLESELFGYEEGAFTGAKKGGKAGLFELADHGTLFLDEIGDIPLKTQAKLLRTLEEKEIMRIGGSGIISVDVRVIAATNRSLDEMMEGKGFRQDLFYRLSNLMIIVPPLRERRDDIPVLVEHFVKTSGRGGAAIDPQVMDFLTRYPWNGNVRELRNCVEYMASVCDGFITREHLPMYISYQERRAKQAGGEDALKRAVLVLLDHGPMGRTALATSLSDAGLPSSEYRIRAVLDALSAAGYVLVSRGRSGCRITEAGRRHLYSQGGQ